MVSLEQVSAQVVHMNSLIDQQNGTIATPTNRLQIADGTMRRGGMRTGMDWDQSDELADKRFLHSPKLTTQSFFREWSEELIEYLEGRDAQLAVLLEKAAGATEEITGL